MVNHIIKICGIRDPGMATQAAIAGANLIGIIFHASSPRYVNPEQAIAISHAAIKAGACPVAVFVNHKDHEMRQICEATNIKIVQLHGAISRAHHHLLPNEFQRIYVKSVPETRELQIDNEIKYLDAGRDLILIDHPKPGHGNTINRLEFHYDLPFRWMLAGGLSPSTVVSAINELQPHGVDVSSGVELSRGNKNIFLIQQFISAVRGSNHDT